MEISIIKKSPKGKKGVFFTLTAILISSLFILAVRQAQPEQENIDRIKIQSIHDFVDDMENSYLEQIISVAGRKALLSYTKYLKKSKGYYAADPAALKQHIREIMAYGTIENKDIDIENGMEIMRGSTIIRNMDMLEQVAKQFYDLDMDIELLSLSISQGEPFKVTVDAEISYTGSNSLGTWSDTAGIQANISIIGLPDPLMAVNGIDNKITESPYKELEWDISSFRQHYTSTTYRFYSKAPAYMQRLYGSFTASRCCGIESVLKAGKFSLPKDFVSYIDYIYFSCSIGDASCRGCYKVAYAYPEESPFRQESLTLDPEHIVSYRIQASKPACT